MGKILGLDLGTNSIGWAIVEKNGSNDFLPVDKGVRIFSEGVKTEKGIESSRAAERTGYRSARKIKFRRKLRKYETLKVLSQNKMCPLSLEELEEWRKSGFKKYPLHPDFIAWLRTDNLGDKSQRQLQIKNPYYFRDMASRQKISSPELGRAFYHIAQRRGFLSNRLDQSAEGIMEQHKPAIEEILDGAEHITELHTELKRYFEGLDILDKSSKDLDEGERKAKTLFKNIESILRTHAADFEKARDEITKRLNQKEDLGAVKAGIDEVSRAMEAGNFKTLGQYFYSLYPKKEKVQATIRNRYTAREEHYLAEFEVICNMQGIGKIEEAEQLPEKRYSGLAKELYKAIFFQRPLKSQKGLIGKCSFEKTKARCAVSHPDFEEYRMWAYLNTIKIGLSAEGTMRFLSQEEKQKLIPKFLRKKNHFNFGELAAELIPKGATYDFYQSRNKQAVHYRFNYKKDSTVAGCPLSTSFKTIFGGDWKTRTFTYQTLDSGEKTVTRTVDYRDLWHLLSVASSNLYLKKYAQEKLGLDEKRAASFSKIRLKKEFASLSLKAILKILPYLKEGLLYSHAVFMANLEDTVDMPVWNHPEERAKIQRKIGEIIENNTYENDLFGAVNGLIKENKDTKGYYSKEAESTYRSDLRKKLGKLLKSYQKETELETILEKLFPVFISQMQKNNGNGEFLKIKRLDEKVLEYLRGENETGKVFCSDEKRLKKLYHPSDIEVFKKKIIKDENGNEKEVLGSPLTSSIKNPMAMRALHQLRKVLNTLILDGAIDAKTRVHIELARELNDANKRAAIQKFQDENKKNRETYITEIKKLYFEECKREIEPTEDDILRYQLWIEQGKKEIYEEKGKNISICDIIGSNPAYDIEHTIPRSVSQDNSLMNKTLCSKRFNREVKKNKIPFELENHEEILRRVDHWREEADALSGKIEGISKAIKAATTKEKKDQKIRERHYLTLKRNYLQGKYERFTWKEPKTGFKNSQLPDTGIITRYAGNYLKSYFNRVESVKGGMVAEFRKIWGLEEGYRDEEGKFHYKLKDRSKHTHHTIDAITIACMTKDKYDVLAHAWTLEDEHKKQEARDILSQSKPWKTFTEDVKKMEEEILVSHHTPDNVKKQAKKIIRIRGKKQYLAVLEKDATGKLVPKRDAKGKIVYQLDSNGEKIPRYRRGDTVRGSLHQDTFYGRIKDPKNQDVLKTVIRKGIEDMKATDIENIVDDMVKAKIKEAKESGTLVFSSNPQQKNKVNDTVWMNEEKGIPIKKVRVYVPSVKTPLEIKTHATLSKSRQTHKQKVYAQNDENYCMAIYDNGSIKDFELINIYNLAKLQKQGQGYYPLYKEKITSGKTIQIPIAKRNNRHLILKRGQQVIFYDKEAENPKTVSDLTDIKGRLYTIEGLSIQRIVRPSGKVDEYGVIVLKFHAEARKSDDLKNDGYKPDGVFKLGEIKPTRKMNHNQFSAFVEGIDFKVLPSGEIEEL